MREEQFKMERKGLVEEGQEVKVTERVNGHPLQGSYGTSQHQ